MAFKSTAFDMCNNNNDKSLFFHRSVTVQVVSNLLSLTEQLETLRFIKSLILELFFEMYCNLVIIRDTEKLKTHSVFSP